MVLPPNAAADGPLPGLPAALSTPVAWPAIPALRKRARGRVVSLVTAGWAIRMHAGWEAALAARASWASNGVVPDSLPKGKAMLQFAGQQALPASTV